MRRYLHLVIILVTGAASVATSSVPAAVKERRWEATAQLVHAETLSEGETWSAKIRFSLRPPQHGVMWGRVTFTLDPVDDINDYVTLGVDDATGRELGVVESPPGGARGQLVLTAFDDCELGSPCEATYEVQMANVRGTTAPRLTIVADVSHTGGGPGKERSQTIEATLVELGTSGRDDTGDDIDTAEDPDTAEDIDTGDSADTGAP